MPKERRRSQLPKATPTWVVEQLLTIAVTDATPTPLKQIFAQ